MITISYMKKILTISLLACFIGHSTPITASSSPKKSKTSRQQPSRSRKSKQTKNKTKKNGHPANNILKAAGFLGTLTLIYMGYRYHQNSGNPPPEEDDDDNDEVSEEEEEEEIKLPEVVVVTTEKTVYLWDHEKKKQRKVDKGDDAEKTIATAALSPNGKLLAIQYDDTTYGKKVVLYGTDDFVSKLEIIGATKFCFSPNGLQIAIAQGVEVEIRNIWDKEKDQFINEPGKKLTQKVDKAVYALAWTHDSNYLAYAGNNQSIFTCHLSSSTCKEFLKDTSLRNVKEISFSYDDKYISCCRQGGDTPLEICSFDPGDGDDTFQVEEKIKLAKSKLKKCTGFRFAPKVATPPYMLASLTESDTVELWHYNPSKNTLEKQNNSFKNNTLNIVSFAWSNNNDVALTPDIRVLMYPDPIQQKFDNKNITTFNHPENEQVLDTTFGPFEDTSTWDDIVVVE